MRNYSNRESSVRVDFFKPSGKWYTTEAVEMDVYYGSAESALAAGYSGPVATLPEALLIALRKHLKKPDGRLRLAGMRAVCLDPWHEHSHPQMVIVPEV